MDAGLVDPPPPAPSPGRGAGWLVTAPQIKDATVEQLAGPLP